MERYLTMKEIPSEEQPYEKFLKYGAQYLSDAELLSIIIRTGAIGEKSLDLAYKILALSKNGDNILNITTATMKELMNIKGIGKVKATQIKCVAELARRIAKTSAKQNLSLCNPSSVADYYMEDLRHVKQEQMILVMLNTKSKLIGDKVMSLGTVNASLVSPREIFAEALHSSAVYIILVHNHPSGDPTPSKEDISVTKRIKEAGCLIGVELLDHIIIGDNCYISLKELGTF